MRGRVAVDIPAGDCNHLLKATGLRLDCGLPNKAVRAEMVAKLKRFDLAFPKEWSGAASDERKAD